MEYRIHRSLSKGLVVPDASGEIEAGEFNILILNEADASDPLNQFLCVALKVGDFALDVRTLRNDDPMQTRNVLAALMRLAVDNAAEIRDHVKE